MTEFTAFLWKLLELILEASLPVLATAFTVFLVQKIREIGKGINADVMQSVRIAVSFAVDAAEQAGIAKLTADKKAYALDLAQKYLDKEGIKVDVVLLEGLVEAAVINTFPHEPAPATG